MRKKITMIVLALGCIVAIYNFQAPSELAMENTAVQKPIETTDLNTDSTLSARVPADQNTTTEVSTSPSTQIQKKVATLKEILKSKNDNDPRMDTELKNLSPDEKDAFVNLYREMKPESLNDKGTIVFLIGRELTRPEDAEFLKNVLSEEPCLSLENCGTQTGQNDPHHDNMNSVTLNYPQVVALNRIKTFVSTQDLNQVNPSLVAQIEDAVRIAQNSKVQMVKANSKEVARILSNKN